MDKKRKLIESLKGMLKESEKRNRDTISRMAKLAGANADLETEIRRLKENNEWMDSLISKQAKRIREYEIYEAESKKIKNIPIEQDLYLRVMRIEAKIQAWIDEA